MDIATLQTHYGTDSKAYEALVIKFLSVRKKISTILFIGTAISLSLFAKFFISPPVRHANTIKDLRTGMDGFILICLCAAGAIVCALQARTLPVLNDLLTETKPSSEQDYEFALEDVQEKLDEGDELLKMQKRLTLSSISLFLASDVLFIILLLVWTD